MRAVQSSPITRVRDAPSHSRRQPHAEREEDRQRANGNASGDAVIAIGDVISSVGVVDLGGAWRMSVKNLRALNWDLRSSWIRAKICPRPRAAEQGGSKAPCSPVSEPALAAAGGAFRGSQAGGGLGQLKIFKGHMEGAVLARSGQPDRKGEARQSADGD